jgi:hypothetical protein
MDDKRFPVGKFQRRPVKDPGERERLIESLYGFPGQLRSAIQDLSGQQLEIPYRDGGWTARQVVHHLADSHMNSFIRFKLALTEDLPLIRPYSQDDWAMTPEISLVPVMISVELLENLHTRWAGLLRGMTVKDFERGFIHPETGEWPLHEVLALYEWHGRHHLGHVRLVRESLGI